MAAKLYYFPVAGRGELIRLIAASGGLELVEENPGADLDKSKFGSPSSLPLLAHGALKMGQSGAIESYLSLLAFPDLTPPERAVDAQFCGMKADVLMGFAKIIFDPSMRATSVGAKELRKVADKWFPVFDKLAPKDGFINCKSYPTAADLAVLNMCEAFMPFGAALRLAGVEMASYPKMAALAARTGKVSKVQAYLTSSASLKADPMGFGKIPIGEPQPSMMRAVLNTGYGELNKVLSSEMCSLPAFDPSSADILVKVYAAALNPIDYKVMLGHMRSMMGELKNFPRIPGADCSGVVVQAGSACKWAKKGDRIFADAAFGLAGIGSGGSLAQYTLMPERYASVAPSNLTFQQCAAIPLAGLTALQALTHKGGVKEGMKVLILGGSGGTGTFGLACAKHLGASYIVTTSSSVVLCKSLGAHLVVNYKDGEDFGELLAGGGFDMVFDAVGGIDHWEKSKKVMKPGARYVTIAGPMVPPEQHGDFKWMLHMTDTGTEQAAKDLETLKQMCESGKMTPVIDPSSPYTLETAGKAFALLQSGRSKGKIVIEVCQDPTEIPTTMKAALNTGYGSLKDTLTVDRCPVPAFDPSSASILVRVYAAALNPIDSHVMQGHMKAMMGVLENHPRVPGCDVSGVVVKAGSACKWAKPGDRIYADWSGNLVGQGSGSLAEYTVMPEIFACAAPSNFTFEQCAAVPLAGLTAWQCLTHKGGVKEGMKVLILGGSGGTGTFGLACAKHLGASYIVTTSSSVDMCKSLGAHLVVNYKDGEDFGELLAGGGFDVVFDAVGGLDGWEKSKKVMKAGARYVTLAGPPVPPAEHGDFKWMFHFTETGTEQAAKDLAALKDMCEKGKLNPVIDPSSPYTLDTVPQAFDLLDSRRAKGKLVIRVF